MSDRNCVLSIEVHGTYTYIYIRLALSLLTSRVVRRM